jgi:hypothetical protein
MKANQADKIKTVFETSNFQFPNAAFPRELSTHLDLKSSAIRSSFPNFLSVRAQRALSKIKAKNFQYIPVKMHLTTSQTDPLYETANFQSTSLLSNKAQRALDMIKDRHLSNSRVDLARIANRSAEREASRLDYALPSPVGTAAPFDPADRSRHCPIFLQTCSIKEAELERQLGRPFVPERPRFADPALALASLLQCTTCARSGGGARRSMETGIFPRAQVRSRFGNCRGAHCICTLPPSRNLTGVCRFVQSLYRFARSVQPDKHNEVKPPPPSNTRLSDSQQFPTPARKRIVVHACTPPFPICAATLCEHGVGDRTLAYAGRPLRHHQRPHHRSGPAALRTSQLHLLRSLRRPPVWRRRSPRRRSNSQSIGPK